MLSGVCAVVTEAAAAADGVPRAQSVLLSVRSDGASTLMDALGWVTGCGSSEAEADAV